MRDNSCNGLFLLVLFLFILNCGGPTSSTNNQDTTVDAQLEDTVIMEYTGETRGLAIPQHNCEIAGEILDYNQMALSTINKLVVVKADSSTFDEALQVFSHRILEVFDLNTCQSLDQELLPVSESPDFPYYLARISYNSNSQLIAIRGFKNFFIYDLEKSNLLPGLEPQFKAERFGADAQSGRILRIELWENYLIGYAQDYGVFAFDLSDENNPKPALPFAEWLAPDESYHSLFLLPASNEGYQVLLPEYDFNNDLFKVNPMFGEPQDIDAKEASGTEDSRFVVFSGSDNTGTSIVVDLQERTLVDLPQNIAQGNNNAILNWVKANL